MNVFVNQDNYKRCVHRMYTTGGQIRSAEDTVEGCTTYKTYIGVRKRVCGGGGREGVQVGGGGSLCLLDRVPANGPILAASLGVFPPS